LPYGLVVNGTLVDLIGDVEYLLSPQDLAAIDHVEELMRAGVKSFKIEGRLKGEEYVHVTTRAYRLAVDAAWDRIISASSSLPTTTDHSLISQDMKQVFSRGQDEKNDGLTPGFLLGPRQQSVVIGRNPRSRGVFVGKVWVYCAPGEGALRFTPLPCVLGTAQTTALLVTCHAVPALGCCTGSWRHRRWHNHRVYRRTRNTFTERRRCSV
jgi:Peptidase family U32